MLTIPLLVLAGIWWLVYLAVRNGRRGHDPVGRCWCLEVHALPPFPKHVPPPPPPKKPEVVYIRLL